jgi:hypothetical protein
MGSTVSRRQEAESLDQPGGGFALAQQMEQLAQGSAVEPEHFRMLLEGKVLGKLPLEGRSLYFLPSSD